MNTFKRLVFIAVLSLITISSKGIAESPNQHAAVVQPVAEAVSLETVEVAKTETPKATATDLIIKYAAIYEADKTELIKVGSCESHLGKLKGGDYKNGVYLARGLFMYHKGTWNKAVSLFKKEMNQPDRIFSIDSIEDQAEVTAFIWAKHPDWKKQWSTYVAYKNGGTYSFYSRVLEKYFTVTCK